MLERRHRLKVSPAITPAGVRPRPTARRRRPPPSPRHPACLPPPLDRKGPARTGTARRVRLQVLVAGRLWGRRIALGHLATDLLDLALRLLALAFPFHLLVAAQLAAGILDLAFDFVTELAHAAPPVFSAISRLLRNIIALHYDSVYYMSMELGRQVSSHL